MMPINSSLRFRVYGSSSITSATAAAAAAAGR